MSWLPAGLIALGYLCGSVPFGVLVTKYVKGVDVRASGSGNIGATNVARVAGKKLGILVLVLDAAKGAGPVALSIYLLPGDYRIHAGVGLAAFLGHCYPVWLKLKGGKGVATALGVFVVLLPLSALAGLVVYAICLAIWRVSSIGSLAGGVVAVSSAFFIGGRPLEYSVLGAVLLALMIWKHRDNIARIARRSERKV